MDVKIMKEKIKNLYNNYHGKELVIILLVYTQKN